jgi:hypothetical protein
LAIFSWVLGSEPIHTDVPRSKKTPQGLARDPNVLLIDVRALRLARATRRSAPWQDLNKRRRTAACPRRKKLSSTAPETTRHKRPGRRNWKMGFSQARLSKAMEGVGKADTPPNLNREPLAATDRPGDSSFLSDILFQAWSTFSFSAMGTKS